MTKAGAAAAEQSHIGFFARRVRVCACASVCLRLLVSVRPSVCPSVFQCVCQCLPTSVRAKPIVCSPVCVCLSVRVSFWRRASAATALPGLVARCNASRLAHTDTGPPATQVRAPERRFQLERLSSSRFLCHFAHLGPSRATLLTNPLLSGPLPSSGFLPTLSATA